MKNITLILALLGAAFSAQAQIATGTKLLSGSIGYSRSQQKTQNSPFGNPENTTQTFNLTPTIGYFVAENLAVGLDLDFTATRISGQAEGPGSGYPGYPNLYDITSKTRVIQVGAFARYYKFVAEKAAFFGQVGAGYANIYSSENYGDRPQGFYANVLPGFAFFPSGKFALELTLRGISYSRVSAPLDINGVDNARNVQNSFDFGIGLQDLRLGAAFYLGR